MDSYGGSDPGRGRGFGQQQPDSGRGQITISHVRGNWRGSREELAGRGAFFARGARVDVSRGTQARGRGRGD
jgi:hypothetical protein